jgi:hypothetical protein
VRTTVPLLAGALACAALLAGCAVTVPGVASPAAPPRSTASAAGDVADFVPSAQDPDPSARIDGVRVVAFQGGLHVRPDQRVAYSSTPPVGGAHDGAWAACNGVVYPQPVRSENIVHSLEHGAVWIAYDPQRITGAGLDLLVARVEGQPYMLLSPYPGMERPVSLQSWGHQLTLDDPADERIDQFVAALRVNQNTFPEPGASCNALGPGRFSQDAPPAFVPTPGADEVDGVTIVAER